VLSRRLWLHGSLKATIRGHLNQASLDLALLCVCLVGLVIFAIHGPYGDGDIRVYHKYAVEFWAGKHAFHTLPTEYPPLTILIFTLAVLPPIHDYSTIFAIWMAAAFLAGYFAFIRFSSRRNAALYAVYLLLGATAALLGRFDILPALLTIGAVWATARRRFGLAYLLLAVGVALKLYPLVLLPILMIEHRRFLVAHDRPWKKPVAVGGLLNAGLVAAGFGIALLLAGENALNPFFYAASRPLQVESFGATLLWFGSAWGFPAITEHGWHSYNLVGPLDGGIITLMTFTGLAGLGWIYWRFWLGRFDLPRAFLAVLCVTLLTSKVFSPQYLIWVLPLVVEVEGIDILWLLICACTTLIYPVEYVNDHIFGTVGPLPYTNTMLGTIAIRNLLLIGATLRVLLPGRSPIRGVAGEPALQEGSVTVSGD
jgi:hypothetical protein